MSRDAKSQINELSSEQEANAKKLRMYQDKVKALEAKEELLTKKGRNKFIFSLGLKVEKYLVEPEYLSEDDLDYILGVALTQPKIVGLMQKFSMLNKEENKK